MADKVTAIKTHAERPMPLPSSMARGRAREEGPVGEDGDLYFRVSERYKERHCAPSQRPVPLVAPLSSWARWKT